MINKSRYTIGYLLEKNSEGYEFNCWSGIVAAANEFDINLLCFAGGAVNTTAGFFAERNKIYDLVNAYNVDGLITSSGPLGHYIKREELFNFLKSFFPLPIVSLGIPFEGIPSLMVDNSSGMYDLIIHLIEAHGFKRIAFIKGPETNAEAIIRFKAYQDALKKSSIELDESLIVQGDFIRDSGRDAIVQLLDVRKVNFDAIVGANDYMALYAMKELQQRGFKVPGDIAVAGFDDLDEAVCDIPALTTVHQPLYELGYNSVSTLLKILNKEKVSEQIILSTKITIRNSCGCFIPFKLQAVQKINLEPGKDGDADDNIKEKKNILQDLDKSIKKEINIINQRYNDHSWLDELVELLIRETKKQQKEEFFLMLGKVVPISLENGVEISIWQKIISTMFNSTISNIESELNFVYIFNLLKKALLYLGNIGEQYQKHIRIGDREIFNALSRINEDFIVSFKKDDLKELFLRELPILGIKSCYLALYADRMDRKQSTLLVYYNSNDKMVNDSSDYPSEELVPGRLNNESEHFKYMIIPLYFKSEQLGFVLFDIGVVDGTLYETLANQLSNSLKQEELVNQIHEYSTQLEKKVEERTAELKQIQKRLVETAHQAGMAEIAVGVLHNAGNILNSINISSQEIARVLRQTKLQGLLKANDILNSNKEDLTGFIVENPKGKALLEYYPKIGEMLKNEYTMLCNESDHLTEKIKIIKETIEMHQNYAQGKFINEELSLTEVIDEGLNIQMNSYERHGVHVHKDYPEEELIIPAQKSKLVHTMLNLFKNAGESLKSSENDNKIVAIKIGYDKNNDIFVSVTDNGTGIKKENLNKIFNYGFTTKKNGHGFGLHTCANFMTEMNAKISAKSDGPEKGAVFTIIFFEKIKAGD